MNELLFLKDNTLRYNIATTPVMLSVNLFFSVCEDGYISKYWGYCKGNHSKPVDTNDYLFVYTILRYTLKNR